MASEALFASVPPFPQDVPVTPLQTLSLSQLRKGDATAQNALFKACQEFGFFLLDLRNDDLGNELISEIDTLFAMGKETFALPEDVKMKYLHDAPRSLLG